MANGSGDSDAASEAGSLFSLQSDFPNEDGLGPGVAPPGDAGEIDDISAQEEFENKMREQIDGLAEKSAKARQAALTGIRSGLSKKIAVDFVGDRKMTIADALERCLKKGKGEEQTQAAAVACLLCVQLGIVDDIESLYAPLRSIFLTIMKDQTAALKARSSCADALGLCCFIAGGENENLVSIMDGLLNVFKASFFKGDGSRPNLPPDVTLLHASALSAWALLLTIAPPSWTSTEINNLLPRLQELLESSDVELRIVAGEVIALSYELARMDNEDFDGSDIDGLCEKLRQLATDSNKYRAKKERRQQRSSFRDILRAVGVSPDRRRRDERREMVLGVEEGAWQRLRHRGETRDGPRGRGGDVAAAAA
ncbi:PREDICTED: interferon-related developmental regulator 2-like isoform X2 [Priapulus caudatus]|uniref:Interferon-related developmental regulator 2-like isoform X2 n=1 Tax=Priapulus caudatus TaxID=37621 RepID=A0ABM1EEI5_PRICU|nr:PREDICTED: interferon-related developmental regulator 2-like isoform X2 [Priapulus caudatus]